MAKCPYRRTWTTNHISFKTIRASWIILLKYLSTYVHRDHKSRIYDILMLGIWGEILTSEGRLALSIIPLSSNICYCCRIHDIQPMQFPFSILQWSTSCVWLVCDCACANLRSTKSQENSINSHRKARFRKTYHQLVARMSAFNQCYVYGHVKAQ